MNSPTMNNEVLSFIRSNCKQLLGAKFWQIRFICKVDAGWKSEKLESKYMVLSKFRIFLLSGKSTSKLQVDASFNVLSISEINATHEPELLLGVDGRKLHLRLTEYSQTAMDVARHLLQSFKSYFPSCDPLRFMHLEPSSLYALFAVLPRSRPSLSCDGFRRTYAALCDFYKLPFRDEVVWDIEKIYTLHNSSILRLDDFSHLYPKDLIPVIASLQFLSWFNGISSENVKLAGEIVDVITVVIRKSQQLKSLVLRNCGLKSDFLHSLASALSANQTIPLDYIDLSGNTFDEGKAVSQLASALNNLNTGCRCLVLSECGLSSKSVNALCTALRNNQKRANSKTLTSVSFAKNTLKGDVVELHHLLTATSLESLDIAGTGVSLEGILFAMKCSNDRISTLILSGCSFPERKGKDLALSNSVKDFFANAATLSCVDLSDCALPSDVLKFMLLGIVCNQKVTGLRLDLTRSFADRQCVSVLETCAPNLASVSDLVLRDINLEQDALALVRSLSLMPNLKRLDIGGNNFNATRKQQPKVLANIMLELAKLINDEDGTLRELVLSECHLGGNISMLLNALGVAPTLISLDISGNDFGNAGARLLAKALQMNGVLETLNIDKNQISYEGYVDIVHSLRGNRTLRCIPYPLHDACESLKWNREKTEAILAEIEGVLQRNSGQSLWNDAPLSTEIHSRLMLANVDDEVNKAVYNTEHLLSECRWRDNGQCDVTRVRTLLDDAEKAKKLLDDMVSVLNRNEFVDNLVEQFANQYSAVFEDKMKMCVSQLADTAVDKNVSVCTDKDFINSLRESSLQRARSFSTALHPVFADFGEKLRQHFKRATFAVACGAAEKVEQEILRSLVAANKNLDETQNSPTIQSSGSMLSAAPSVSSSSGTPKSKRKKFRLFARSTRPKSIIESDGALDNADEIMEDMVTAGTPVDSCGDSLDSESFEVVDKPTTMNDDANDETPKLIHIVKDRPRLPYQRRQRAVATKEKEDLEYAAGVDSFFGPSKTETPTSANATSPTKEQAPAEAAKRLSRLPPNAVPLLSADILHERGALTKVAVSPRAPPNTPSSALKPHQDAQSSSSTSVTVTSGSTDETTEESSPKHVSNVSQSSTSSRTSENTPTITSSPTAPARPAPPSPTKTTAQEAATPLRYAQSELLTQVKPLVVGESQVDWSAGSSLPSQSSPPLPPRARDSNGNTPTGGQDKKGAASTEQNNNAAAESTPLNTSGAKSTATPPPRPPPPSSKLRDAKHRQPEASQSMELPEEAVLRNKPTDGPTAQQKQRKSVMDLTAMFETKPPVAGRPVPPPRPTKNKVAPSPN